MGIILKAKNISKQYRLGLVGTGTLSHDLNRFWYRIRGKEDPYLKVGAANDRSETATENYVWALRDINFEVQEGEVLGIIGKNGAGKSTLLKILSKVTSPTTGVIKTKGRIASLLEVGTGFHPELTGRENIYLNGAILGMNKKEIASKEEEIVDFSGCAMYIDTPVKRYSSGMRVRLAFAVAAHLEPDILVIDEVLAVGDAEFQKKAIGKMQDISKTDGRTVLFVSHNMAAVKSLCTRAIVLEHGYVKFEGQTDEAVDFYLQGQSFKEQKDLLEREDRLGNGNVLFSEVNFINENGHNVTDVVSGKALTLQLKLIKKRPVNYLKLFVGVALLDKNQQKVATFLSDEMGSDLAYVEHKDVIELYIPKLYLRAGTYSVTLQLCDDGPKRSGFVDIIEHAATLNVLGGDIWNVGNVNRSGNFAIFPATYQ
tara:strand:+ start:17127 stop:18407 length:1281 start_codon:yes stop_codon:yes gene_type:complete